MGRERSPSAENLADYIQIKIMSGEYPVGSRLPSVRRLAAKFNLSFGSAYRMIQLLLDKGLLEQRESKGFFIRAHAVAGGGDRGGIAVIAAPTRAPHAGLIHAAGLGIERAAAAAGYRIEFHYIPLDQLTVQKLGEIAPGVDGILLLGEYDAYLRTFPVLPCPTVAMLSATSWGGAVSTVNIDAEEAACAAETYFGHAGETGIGHVNVYTSPKPVYLARAHAFESRWLRRGNSCRIYVGYPDRKIIHDSDCGHFFTSDHWLQLAAKDFLREYGTPVDARKVLLGVDGKQFIMPCSPAFPTVSVNWPVMGEMMVEELMRRRARPDREPRNISICGKIRTPEVPREVSRSDSESIEVF